MHRGSADEIVGCLVYRGLIDGARVPATAWQLSGKLRNFLAVADERNLAAAGVLQQCQQLCQTATCTQAFKPVFKQVRSNDLVQDPRKQYVAQVQVQQGKLAKACAV